MKTKREAEAEIVRILRAIKLAESQRRTILLRDLAEAIIDLREHYLTPAGNPDWTGRSGVYRIELRNLYSEAGYTTQAAQSVQSSLAYHVGNALRDRLKPRELEDLGVHVNSPQTRSRDIRREQLKQLKLWKEHQEQEGAQGD